MPPTPPYRTQGIPNFIFDPLELAEQDFYDEGNDATIGFIRQAELKHGRVAMAGEPGTLSARLLDVNLPCVREA